MALIKQIWQKYLYKKAEKFTLKFLLKIILLLVPAVVLIIIMNINTNMQVVKTDPVLSAFFHPAIWITYTSYIVFWEARNYFQIYGNFFKRIFNMDSLIGTAAHILYVYSLVITIINQQALPGTYEVFWEATILLLIFTKIGHAIENRIIHRTTELYQQINDLNAKTVLVLANGRELPKKVGAIRIGETIIVKKGEMVPLDAKLVSPEGFFDKSNITGEARMVHQIQGSQVISGAYNIGANLELKVVQDNTKSFIYKVARSIEEISYSKPKAQKIANRLLKYFIPFVFATFFLTIITWVILIHFNLVEREYREALTIGVAVLAIACPCAIGIATPLINAITSLKSLQMGFTVNEPDALENIRNAHVIVFDKTGTLTENHFTVTQMLGDLNLLPIAASLERKSDHPIARAIAALSSKSVTFDHFSNKAAHLIVGATNGQEYALKAIPPTQIAPQLDRNATLIGLFQNNVLKISFVLKAQVKPLARAMIHNLKKMRIQPIMLTGDNRNAAAYVANQVGIQRFYHSQLPHQKAALIQKLQQQGSVIFVGDGFNDIAAAKQANLSFAFASGSPITNELASVSIRDDGLDNIAKIFRISNLNNRFIVTSLLWAIIFNMIMIPLAFLGIAQPWMAALMMVASDFLLVANALFYKRILQKLRSQ